MLQVADNERVSERMGEIPRQGATGMAVNDFQHSAPMSSAFEKDVFSGQQSACIALVPVCR